MKRAAKKDANHTTIVAKLEALGYHCIDTSQLKNAFDILIVTPKGIFIVEIKNPEYLRKDYTQQDIDKQLSSGERKCKQRVEAAGGKYYTIATFEQIKTIIEEQ